MNKYETVVILKGDLPKVKELECINKIEEKIINFGEITEKQDMGIRKLAYQIQNKDTGHYLVFRYTISENKSKEAITEIERLFRITDEVLKFLTIKV